MPSTELEQLQLAWKNNPNTEAFYPLARAYMGHGLFEAAAEVLHQGLRHHPEHCEALAALGQVQFRRSDVDEARDTLNKALKFDSDCGAVLCVLAEIEIEAGNFQRAEGWLRRAEALSDIPCAVILRQQLEYKRRNHDDSMSDITFVTETMVDLFLKQGMQEKAVAVLTELVNRKPDDATLRQRLEELSDSMHGAITGCAFKNAGVQEQLNAWLRAIEHRKQEKKYV